MITPIFLNVQPEEKSLPFGVIQVIARSKQDNPKIPKGFSNTD
jgi:hypothetical protein